MSLNRIELFFSSYLPHILLLLQIIITLCAGLLPSLFFVFSLLSLMCYRCRIWRFVNISLTSFFHDTSTLAHDLFAYIPYRRRKYVRYFCRLIVALCASLFDRGTRVLCCVVMPIRSFFCSAAIKTASNPSLAFVELRVMNDKHQSCTFSALVDSGSCYSFINQSVADYLRFPFEMSNELVTGFQGSKLRISSPINIPISISSFSSSFSFRVAPNLQVDFILGRDFFVANKVDILFSSSQLCINGTVFASLLPHYNNALSFPVYSSTSSRFLPGRSGHLPVIIRRLSPFSLVFEPSLQHDNPFFLLGTGVYSPHSTTVDIQVANCSSVSAFVPKNTLLGHMHVLLPDVISDCTHGCYFIKSDTTLPPPSVSAETITDNKQSVSDEKPESAFSIDQFNVERSLCPAVMSALASLLYEFRDIFCFDGKPGLTDLLSHEIILTSKIPVRVPPRRMTPPQREIVDKAVDEFLANGIIRPSKSPYSFPLVLVGKPDGSTRVCVDFRKLNAITVKDSYSLPRVDESLDCLGKAKFFTTLDLQSAYHQVPMHENSIDKTAFSCHRGLFAFTSMPFGLVNAGACFQRLMDIVLSGLNWVFCLVYMDDIICWSSDEFEHIDRLRKIFERLRRHHLKLKPKKCFFFRKSLKYLGHIVSDKGLSCDPEKVSAVVNFPRPDSLKSLRSFLGLVGYYRRLIENFSDISASLHKASSPNIPFKWSDECEHAFISLKSALTTAPILAFPDFQREFFIHCDASDVALGAQLTQKDDNNVERPVSFASRILSPTEAKWSVTEREALALFWSVEHFRPYIYGRKFTVITDHRSLLWLRSLKNPSKRVARWMLVLDPLDFTIVHKAGKLHAVPDALSRYPPSVNMISNFSLSPTDFLVASISLVDNLRISPEKIAQSQLDDPHFSDIISALRNNSRTPPSVNSSSSFITRQLARLYKFLVLDDNNVAYWCPCGSSTSDAPKLLLLPECYRLDVLQHLHNSAFAGHLGPQKTYLNVKARFYWPSMRADIFDYCYNCVKCAEHRINNKPMRAPMTPIMEPVRPFTHIAMDLIILPLAAGSVRYCLVVSDYFTKWPEFYPLSSFATDKITKCLLDWISHYGCPEVIISDRGTNFTSDTFSDLCRRLHVTRRTTTAYRPQSDGLVERLNRTLKQMLGKFVSIHKGDWPDFLPYLAMAYRSAVHSSTGFSPFYLTFARSPLLPIDVIFPTTSFSQNRVHKIDYAAFVEEHLSKLRSAHSAALRILDEKQSAQKAQYDKKSSSRFFKVNDFVFLDDVRLHTPLGVPSLTPKRTGPFKIIAVDKPGITYKIQALNNPNFVDTVNVDKLTFFPTNPNNFGSDRRLQKFCRHSKRLRQPEDISSSSSTLPSSPGDSTPSSLLVAETSDNNNDFATIIVDAPNLSTDSESPSSPPTESTIVSTSRPSSPAPGNSSSSNETLPTTIARKRGRPLGSKNRPVQIHSVVLRETRSNTRLPSSPHARVHQILHQHHLRNRKSAKTSQKPA